MIEFINGIVIGFIGASILWWSRYKAITKHIENRLDEIIELQKKERG